jgi:hypothetical protein
MIPRHLIIGVVVLLIAVLGLGAYMWHMRSRAQTPVVVDARPVNPPVSGPTELVTLYVAHDGPGSIRPQSVAIPLTSARQLRAEAVLRALISLYLDKTSDHPLPAGSEANSVFLIEPDLAVIDLNPALADGHRSGVLVETLTVGSLVESLAANVNGITRVRILVGGKTRDTLAGHADLSDAYDVAAVGEAVKALQGVE